MAVNHKHKHRRIGSKVSMWQEDVIYVRHRDTRMCRVFGKLTVPFTFLCDGSRNIGSQLILESTVHAIIPQYWVLTGREAARGEYEYCPENIGFSPLTDNIVYILQILSIYCWSSVARLLEKDSRIEPSNKFIKFP